MFKVKGVEHMDRGLRYLSGQDKQFVCIFIGIREWDTDLPPNLGPSRE